MNEILDAPEQTQVNPLYIQYGGVVRRIGAFIADMIFITIISALNNFIFSFGTGFYINTAIFTILVLLYRPLMEGYYGATLGKMLFKLKVVNQEFTKATFSKTFARNIFHIVYLLVNAGFAVYIYYQFQNMSTDMVLSNGENLQVFGGIVIGAYAFILLLDLVIMLGSPKYYSLHDRIAGTYVVKAKSLTSRGPVAAVYGQPNGRASELLVNALKRNGIDTMVVERDASLGLFMQVRHYAYLIVDQIKAGNTVFDNHYQCIRELIGSDNVDIINALQLNLFLTLNEELGTNNIFEQQMPETIKQEYFKAVLGWSNDSKLDA